MKSVTGDPSNKCTFRDTFRSESIGCGKIKRQPARGHMSQIAARWVQPCPNVSKHIQDYPNIYNISPSPGTMDNLFTLALDGVVGFCHHVMSNARCKTCRAGLVRAGSAWAGLKRFCCDSKNSTSMPTYAHTQMQKVSRIKLRRRSSAPPLLRKC